MKISNTNVLIIIISLIIILPFQTNQCYLGCSNCFEPQQNNNNPYQCTNCRGTSNTSLFISSCQKNQVFAENIALGSLGIISIIFHFSMLALGYGIYRNIYQNIQLISLISWGSPYNNNFSNTSGIIIGSTKQLQITNLAIFKQNNFIATFGPQFFSLLTIIIIFYSLVSTVQRLPHNSFAILIKRKKIIFPFRLQTLFFNIIVFSAFSEVINNIKLQIFSFIIAIIAIIKQTMFLCIVAYVTNFRNFQIDDQKYYVLIQRLSTKKWYARNMYLITLLVRLIIIIVFIAGFSNPQISGLIITLFQISYTFVSFATLKYIKLRYSIFNLFGNLFTSAIYLCTYKSASNINNIQIQNEYSKAAQILILMLISFFILINIIEIIANSNSISRQLKSIYLRFIICKKMDDAVELNKYDSDKYRQKVTSFRKNLIYHENFQLNQEKQNQIEMKNKQIKRQYNEQELEKDNR